jgi:ketosteroid isomerase-like protein
VATTRSSSAGRRPSSSSSTPRSKSGRRSYRGHEGFRQYLADTREVWGQFRWEATELVDAGDSVVARTRFVAEGRGSGVPVEAIVYIVWVVRDGKALSCRGYLDRDEALTAAAAVRDTR